MHIITFYFGSFSKKFSPNDKSIENWWNNSSFPSDSMAFSLVYSIKKRERKVLFAIVVLLPVMVWIFPTTNVKTSIPGRIIRLCHGEALYPQYVNDAADLIISKKWQNELENLSDTLIAEYLPQKASLPIAKFTSGGYLIPNKRIPIKFYRLGWMWSKDTQNVDVFIKTYNDSNTALKLNWGDGRYSVSIFLKEPETKPGRLYTGWYTRSVGKRIYIAAGE